MNTKSVVKSSSSSIRFDTHQSTAESAPSEPVLNASGGTKFSAFSGQRALSQNKVLSALKVFSWQGALLALATMSLFVLLVKLGFWQLERAEYKQQWQSELSARQAAGNLSYAQLLELPRTEQPTGYRLSTSITPVAEHIFLLDNQTYQGRVGYLALQAVAVAPDMPWLLVELGFIPAGMDRRVLPDVTPITQAQHLSGRIYRRQANPMSSALMAESGWPKRIQNLNLEQLSSLLGRPLAPAVLQPDTLIASDYPHPWNPIALPAQKHYGYAVQWFAMSFALLILTLFAFYKQTRSLAQ